MVPPTHEIQNCLYVTELSIWSVNVKVEPTWTSYRLSPNSCKTIQSWLCSGHCQGWRISASTRTFPSILQMPKASFLCEELKRRTDPSPSITLQLQIQFINSGVLGNTEKNLDVICTLHLKDVGKHRLRSWDQWISRLWTFWQRYTKANQGHSQALVQDISWRSGEHPKMTRIQFSESITRKTEKRVESCSSESATDSRSMKLFSDRRIAYWKLLPQTQRTPLGGRRISRHDLWVLQAASEQTDSHLEKAHQLFNW